MKSRFDNMVALVELTKQDKSDIISKSQTKTFKEAKTTKVRDEKETREVK